MKLSINELAGVAISTRIYHSADAVLASLTKLTVVHLSVDPFICAITIQLTIHQTAFEYVSIAHIGLA